MHFELDEGKRDDLRQATDNFVIGQREISILGMRWAQAVTTGSALGSTFLHLGTD